MYTAASLIKSLRLPVIGAPMFIISTPSLVSAQCCSGIIGTFPSLNARPQHILKQWINDIKSTCESYKQVHPSHQVAPFGVNLVAIDSNKRLEKDLETCINEQVPIIITSMKPPQGITKQIHAYGGLHFHDVINRRHAEKAVEAGVDGLILVCNGAGGHAGTGHPFAFVSEIRSWFSGLIILSGCITTGHHIAAAKIIGADMAYIGTGFIATHEANASNEYKKMLIKSKMDDIIYTPEFTGVNANFLKDSIQKCGINPDTVSSPSYKKPNKLWLLWKHWRMKHHKQWKDLWSAGQGVSAIHTCQSVADYVDQLKKEYIQCTSSL